MAYHYKAFQTDVNLCALGDWAQRAGRDPTSSDSVKDLCECVEFLVANVILADRGDAKMLGVPSKQAVPVPPRLARAFVWMGTHARRGEVLHYECDTADALPRLDRGCFLDWFDAGWRFSGAPPVTGTDDSTTHEIIVIGLEKVLA